MCVAIIVKNIYDSWIIKLGCGRGGMITNFKRCDGMLKIDEIIKNGDY